MAWQCTSYYPNVIFFFCKLTILLLAVPMSDFCFQSMQRWSILIGFFKENSGRFPFNKNSGLKFRKFHVPNGTVQSCTFQLHRPNPSHCMFAHCSCKQDTKERFWGQQFCEMEKGHFSPTDQNDQTSQRGPSSKPLPNIPVRPMQTEMVHSIWCTNQNVQNFGLNGKHP